MVSTWSQSTAWPGSVLFSPAAPGYPRRVRTRRHLVGSALALGGVLVAMACSAPASPPRSTGAPQTSAAQATPPTPATASASPATPATPPKAGRGLLTVRTHPPGALVIIEGVLMGQTPVERVDVEAGPHQMIIAMPGYEAIGTSVTVGAGEHVVHEVTLSHATASGPAGPPATYDDPHCPYASQSCKSDCWRERFHCETDCGSCSDCGSSDDPMRCMVCMSCKTGCKQIEKTCERGCERLCP